MLNLESPPRRSRLGFWRKIDEPTESASIVLQLRNGPTLYRFAPSTVDSLRHATTRLMRDESLPKRLALVSALRGEGVTHIAQALGTTLAHDTSLRVCVVDLNWHFPHNSWRLPQASPGVAGVVDGVATLENTLVPTTYDNLSLLPSGHVPALRRPVVARNVGLKTMLNELDEHFDHVIFDVPAILATSDAIVLASLAEGCCLVVRHGSSSISLVERALDEVSHVPQLGVILNAAEITTPTRLLRWISPD